MAHARPRRSRPAARASAPSPASASVTSSRVLKAKENSAFYRKAFAHLRPIPVLKAQGADRGRHLGDFIGDDAEGILF